MYYRSCARRVAQLTKRTDSSHRLNNVGSAQWLEGQPQYLNAIPATHRHLPLAGTEQFASTCLVSRVDSAHHLYGVGEMSTGLQETGEKQVRIAWSTIKLPNGATQDDDNHTERDPMNLSPYACSGLTTCKNNKTDKKENKKKRTINSFKNKLTSLLDIE